MSIKSRCKNIRDSYVVNQAQSVKLPEFTDAPIKRYRIVFSGRVQKVGFRLEVSELAKRLGLTGYCRNLASGDVEAELQGPDNRIQFLLSFMESLIRIRIREKTVEELEVKDAEGAFLQF